ncbi:mitochondrial translation release factor in rescue [Stomoxys calcitrans]|uniref:mitochondrial translation release factor in rescue n=1 Tax=Stomoxys calcitrans TaxID=35570 RepID=UPI0027E263FC|nr:mitochondrial translation release factor in rescue [Stomoxys calcitrans]
MYNLCFRLLRAGIAVQRSIISHSTMNALTKPVVTFKSPAHFSSLLFYRFKHQQLDYSRYPTLNEEDLEETFTRGSGPGGQAVNKTSNCVLLRHLPTNIVVKCHIHRSAQKNRVEARKILLEKLDAQLNGEYSIQSQLKQLENKKSAERKRRQTKLQEMKQKWKEREEQAGEGENKIPPADQKV